MAIVSYAMLVDELSAYRAPGNKIMRLSHEGKIIPLARGLYETDPATKPQLLAASIYGPSYVSFEFALGLHGLIPERVEVVTCASFNKRKRKRFDTPFGAFSYQDVPERAFPLGLQIRREGEYAYRIASPEKALCDQLYKKKPASSLRELRQLLFDDLRIDRDAFASLDFTQMSAFASAYKSTNARLLRRLLEKEAV